MSAIINSTENLGLLIPDHDAGACELFYVSLYFLHLIVLFMKKKIVLNLHRCSDDFQVMT